MILKSKSPFTKDKAICKTHQKPLIYICEDHNDEDEIWCEDCTPNPHCAVINMKWNAETLKDTLRVEARNFAHDIETIRDLNKKRQEWEEIDFVFNKIYDSLSVMHAEIKARNRPE